MQERRELQGEGRGELFFFPFGGDVAFPQICCCRCKRGALRKNADDDAVLSTITTLVVNYYVLRKVFEFINK